MNIASAFWLAVLLGVPSSPPAVAPPITAIAFAPDSDFVVVGSQAGIELRGWPDLNSLKQLETQLTHVHDIEFSHDGSMMAAVGGAPAETGELELFDWPTGNLRWRCQTHEDVVYAVAWNEDSTQLATAAGDQLVAVHDVSSRQSRILEGHSRRVLSVCFLPTTNLLISAGVDRSLRVWDDDAGTVRRTMENHTDRVRALAARPRSAPSLPMIASAGADRTVRLWQPTIGRLVRFAQLIADPLDIKWTPDGRRLVCVCVDGSLCVIDPETVEIVKTISVFDCWAYSLAIAPNGREAVVGATHGRVKRITID